MTAIANQVAPWTVSIFWQWRRPKGSLAVVQSASAAKDRKRRQDDAYYASPPRGAAVRRWTQRKRGAVALGILERIVHRKLSNDSPNRKRAIQEVADVFSYALRAPQTSASAF